MNIKTRHKKRLSFLFAVLMLSVFAAGVSADPVTPYEDENEYYEESYSSEYEEPNYDDESSYEESTPSYEESSESEPVSESSASSQQAAAVNSESSSSSGASSNSSGIDESGESSTDENYVVFGKMGNKSNDVAGFLNTIAISCMALGIVGIICVIVWSASTREIKKESDDYIYETVGHAQRDSRSPQVRENPYSYNDNYNVNPKSAAPKPQRPPQQRTQPQRTAQQRPAGAAPAAQQRPRPQAAQDRVQQHTVDIPSLTNQRKPAKQSDLYDTDEILNEILGDKRKHS